MSLVEILSLLENSFADGGEPFYQLLNGNDLTRKLNVLKGILILPRIEVRNKKLKP